MAFINQGARRAQTALSSATSANGTARNGAAVSMALVHPGTLVADCSVTIVTGSVVCTVKHEVSLDGSTYFELAGLPNNAANVTITATVANKAIPVPEAASAYPFYRTVMTLSGAATAGGDLTACTNRYLSFNDLE
jgi:hypothetical protein